MPYGTINLAPTLVYKIQGSKKRPDHFKIYTHKRSGGGDTAYTNSGPDANHYCSLERERH